MSAAKPRIPDSVSIMELAERMQKQGKVTLARPSAEEVRKKLTLESLASGVGDPRVAVEAGADYPGFMRLRCEEVDYYDRNPRTSLNPRYTEIRDSIIERGGLQGPLTVTRRPGAKRYMLYMGGNTRLQIVRELWRTTRAPRYEWINVTFHEWVNEADIIAAHLIENEARADTTFFEKAGGLAVLKDELEKLRGTSLTLRELGVEAKRLGMKVSAVAAMNYLYAVAELSALGPLLTHENVNAIRTHAARHEKLISVLNLDPFAYRDAFRAIVDAAAARLVSSEEVSRTSALDGAQTQQLLDAMDRALARQADLDPGRIKDVLAEIASSGAGPSSARIREVAARADDERADSPHDAAAAAVTPEQRGDDKAHSAGGDSRRSQSPSPAAPPADDLALAAEPPVLQPTAAPAPAEEADRGFFDELVAFCGAFEIEALLCLHDSMPHGFYMEFPSDYFELLPADAAADPNLRRAAYLYLVALSRQLEQGVAERMPAASAWRKLVDKDPLDPSGSFETRYAQSCMGISGEFGVHGLSAHDVAYLLCQPAGWQRLSALMRCYHSAFGASTNLYLDGEESAPTRANAP